MQVLEFAGAVAGPYPLPLQTLSEVLVMGQVLLLIIGDLLLVVISLRLRALVAEVRNIHKTIAKE